MYAEIADAHASVAEFVDAGAAVLDQGRWTNTLPCLPGEPCTAGIDVAGQVLNVVRAPDGHHFCPIANGAHAGVTDACPVWSMGPTAGLHGRPDGAALQAWQSGLG
jgi:hypothetical protein